MNSIDPLLCKCFECECIVFVDYHPTEGLFLREPTRPERKQIARTYGGWVFIAGKGRGEPGTPHRCRTAPQQECALHQKPVGPDTRKVCGDCLHSVADLGLPYLVDPGADQRRALAEHCEPDDLVENPWNFPTADGSARPHECPPVGDSPRDDLAHLRKPKQKGRRADPDCGPAGDRD